MYDNNRNARTKELQRLKTVAEQLCILEHILNDFNGLHGSW